MANEIIKNGTIDNELSLKIKNLETTLKSLKAQEEDLKEALVKAMRENGIVKIENDLIAVTYVAETSRESLDTKALKEECGEIYDAYCKLTTVKDSVRIKVK